MTGRRKCVLGAVRLTEWAILPRLLVLCLLVVAVIPGTGGLAQAAPTSQADAWQAFLPGEKVTSLALYGKSIWVGTNGHGVINLSTDTGQGKPYRAADGLASDTVTCVMVDGRGHVWAGTHRGLSEFDGKTWKTSTKADGLLDDVVNTLALDAKGNVVIGTSVGVGVRMDNQWWLYAPVQEGKGQSPPQVVSLARDPKGTLWAGAWFEGLNRLEGKAGWVPVTPEGSTDSYRRVQAVAFGPNGDVWIGTVGGVLVLRDNKWQAYQHKDGDLPSDWVQAIAVEPTGRAWLGTDNGLSLFDGNQWAVYTRSNSSLAGNSVRAIVMDPRGFAWVGTDGGLNRVSLTAEFPPMKATPVPSAGPPRVEPPLRQAWKTILPGEGSVQAMLGAEDAIYLMTAEGIVHALSAADGHTLWQTSGWLVPQTRRCPYEPPQLKGVTAPGPLSVPPVLLALDGDTLIAAVCAGWQGYTPDQQLLLLDRATGQLRGTWPVIGGRLMGTYGGVMVTSSKDGVVAISLKDRREVWRVPAPDPYNPPYLMAVADDVVLIKTYDKDYKAHESARSVADGTPLWETTLVEARSPRAWAAGLAFAIYESYQPGEAQVLAFDSRTGADVFQADLGSLESAYQTYLGLTVQGDTLYAYSRTDPAGIAAYESQTGQRLWSAAQDLPVQDVRALGDLIYFVGGKESDTRLYAASPEDGQVIWSGLPEPGMTLGPIVADTLFLATSQAGVSGNDAVLTALRERP